MCKPLSDCTRLGLVWHAGLKGVSTIHIGIGMKRSAPLTTLAAIPNGVCEKHPPGYEIGLKFALRSARPSVCHSAVCI